MERLINLNNETLKTAILSKEKEIKERHEAGKRNSRKLYKELGSLIWEFCKLETNTGTATNLTYFQVYNDEYAWKKPTEQFFQWVEGNESRLERKYNK